VSDAYSAAFAAATATGAMIAACASYFQARTSGKAYESVVYLTLAARYNSNEMREALNVLAAWRREHPEQDFADRWARLVNEGDAAAREANAARRLVDHYFIDMARLHRVGAIGRHMLDVLTDVHGLNVFYEIASPMTAALAPRAARHRPLARTLTRIKRRYAEGEILQHF
jgi:hypothetical protein